MGFFKKIFSGLAKTAQSLTSSITQIFTKTFDDEFYDDLTAVLLSADVGVAAAEQIIDDLKAQVRADKIKTEEELKRALSVSIANLLRYKRAEIETPCAFLVVGVNGVGKTTTIGKLATMFKGEGRGVLVAAADTFRAAATEQLDIWAGRAGVRIVKQNQGSDPASVVFDALSSATARRDDIVIIDTAGRLHNKAHLMEELKKIDRVVAKFNIPCKKVIVLDATTGQNALNQVEVFNEALGGGLDGVILTKLDGTAKGGVVVAIKKEFDLPVLYVGVGEKVDDLIEFNADDFANALFNS
jgi:fused signal recognition particle receptor